MKLRINLLNISLHCLVLAGKDRATLQPGWLCYVLDHDFVDARNLDTQQLALTIRGKASTTVRLQILPADAPPGSPPQTVSIVRNQFKITP